MGILSIIYSKRTRFCVKSDKKIPIMVTLGFPLGEIPIVIFFKLKTLGYTPTSFMCLFSVKRSWSWRAYTVIRCSVPLLEQTHPVQDVSPALHRDALKHSQHGKCKVIKVCDSIIWALPSHHALRYIGQGAMSSMDRAWGTGGRLLFRYRTWKKTGLCQLIWSQWLEQGRYKYKSWPLCPSLKKKQVLCIFPMKSSRPMMA